MEQYCSSYPKCAGALCPICNGKGEQIQTEPIELRTCCGVLLHWEWDSISAYESMYTTNQYHDQEIVNEGYMPYQERHIERLDVAQKRINEIKAVTGRTGSLLDIGCAEGSLLQAGTHAGFHCVGIEPCPKFSSFEIKTGTYNDIKGLYSTITMYDVFEHLTSPSECLGKIKNHLNRNGVLVIQTPEYLSPDFNRHQLNWKHVKRCHIALYSDSAIRCLFAESGFTVIAYVSPLLGKIGQAVYYLLRSDDCM